VGFYQQTFLGDPKLTEIHRDEHHAGVFIGGIGAARNFVGLNECNIRAVLDVAAGDPRQQAGLELPAVAEHGTAALALSASTAVRRVEEVYTKCVLFCLHGTNLQTVHICMPVPHR